MISPFSVTLQFSAIVQKISRVSTRFMLACNPSYGSIVMYPFLSLYMYQDPDRILCPVVWSHSHSILKYSPSTLSYTAAVHHQRAPYLVLAEKRPIPLMMTYITVYKCDLGLLLQSSHGVPTGVSVNCYHLVSRGRKSKLLFKSGKRMAEALMTSVGFGVT